jgi:hypothetical protein
MLHMDNTDGSHLARGIFRLEVPRGFFMLQTVTNQLPDPDFPVISSIYAPFGVKVPSFF